MKKARVYICHTFYHVYIAAVKELTAGQRGAATLVLSTMSNDFQTLPDRLKKSGLFEDVYLFDELPDTASEDVMRYHLDRGNILLNLPQRITYTRLLGKLQEERMPLDLTLFRDVYVFCDSDPIGYYLNYKKIPYHAIEDGLNSGKLDDMARNSNRRAFGIKRLFARAGLIFIPNGYSRYCIDYEVNDLSVLKGAPGNAFAVPRDEMMSLLTPEDHRELVDLFLEDADGLRAQLRERSDRPSVMILTEPLCELPVREKLFGDIIAQYEKDYTVLIKPHPRDVLDYEAAFPDTVVIRGRFPMEVMNDMTDLKVDKVISVITQVENITFAKETVYLGLDFLDRYEDPAVHRKTERLWEQREGSKRKG